MDRLIVNNEDLDLLAGTTLTLNYQIGSIADISTRKSTFSNTLTLPRTSKNERIMGMVGAMGNTSRSPYLKLKCTYYKGSTPLIKDGWIFITESTPTSYKVNLFDGVIDFQEKLGAKTLRDLDYADINHYFTQENYEASFGNENGFIYGIGDFGNQPIDFVQIANQAPSVFAHTLWDKIMGNNGISYVGSFFTENHDWKNYVATPKLGFSPFASIISTSWHGTPTTTGHPTMIQIREDRSNPFVETRDIIHSGTLIGAEYSIGSGVVTCNFTGLSKITLTFDYINVYADVLHVQIIFNGDVVHTEALDGYVAEDTSTPKQRIVEQQRQVETGDYWYFRIYAESRNFTHWPNLDVDAIRYDYASKVSLNRIESTGDTYFVDFKDIVSDMKQADFIKDMMQRYGLMVYKRGVDRYEFRQLEDLLADRANAVDWTKKLTAIKKENYDSGYAQNNIASYTYPQSVAEHSYDGIIEVENETADFEKDMIKSIFEIPSRTNDFMGRAIYSSHIWDPEKKNAQDIAYDNKDDKSKLMTLDRGNTTFDFKYFTFPEYDITGSIPTLSLDNVEYQYFLDQYYPRFNQLLNSYKEIEVEINLDPIDLAQVDFFRQVFLRQTGRYYLLDSIRTGSTTTAKLIEIN